MSEMRGRIGCVIMASGQGKRFGGNKLMADLGGKPMIRRILDETEDLFYRRVVVTRHSEIERLCRMEGIPVILHDLPGRNDTIRLGLEAIGQDIDHCMFTPADQPLLTRETIRKLIGNVPGEPDKIWRVASREQTGAPVIFPKDLFGELMKLPEGKGGGIVIRKYPDRLRIMMIENADEILDVDTQEDLVRIESILRNLNRESRKGFDVSHI